jgi:glutaredoxin
MKIVRIVLGALILFFDWVFTPRGVKRESEAQETINKETEKLSLYQYKACPFCVKVRRSLQRTSLNVVTKDAKRCDTAKDELVNGGGQLKVPCLKIESENGDVNWMYESSEIINYLDQRFAAKAA